MNEFLNGQRARHIGELNENPIIQATKKHQQQVRTNRANNEDTRVMFVHYENSNNFWFGYF